jgi:AcrR family transcriptional regulator
MTALTRDPASAIAKAFSERVVRRDGELELPLGPKAKRTRQSILQAAADVFGANGYQRTTVADVAAAAGVSLGTVYQYFRDRSDLVAALVQQTLGDMLRRTDTVWRASEGTDGLRRVLLNFVTGYAQAAPMAAVWEEVTHIEPDLAELRRALGQLLTMSVERSLRQAADAGLIEPGLDPELTAVALAGMVDRYCYVTYVFDPPAVPPTPAESAAVLTRLWSAAVGLRC